MELESAIPTLLGNPQPKDWGEKLVKESKKKILLNELLTQITTSPPLGNVWTAKLP